MSLLPHNSALYYIVGLDCNSHNEVCTVVCFANKVNLSSQHQSWGYCATHTVQACDYPWGWTGPNWVKSTFPHSADFTQSQRNNCLVIRAARYHMHWKRAWIPWQSRCSLASYLGIAEHKASLYWRRNTSILLIFTGISTSSLGAPFVTSRREMTNPLVLSCESVLYLQ